MNKVFVVMVVARQVEGEYCFIRGEKAFLSNEKAEAYKNSIKSNYVTPEGKVKIIMLTTPNGSAQCFCEVGIFEFDIEE